MDAQQVPGHGAPTVRYVSGGSQNEIFEVERDGVRMALRKPPQTAVAARDDGIRREWRILSALSDTDVPHARAVAMCDDPAVLGRPFYLMEFVDGWSPMGHPDGLAEPFHSDVAARAGLATGLVDGAALLGRVDWRSAGLTDFGRPEGFHDRQVDRWLTFWERTGGRDAIAGMAVATAWLRTHRPIDFVPGIMHGDYQFANVMFRHGAPGTLAALVDWEMGTIGDPKLDLAWALRDWPAAGPPRSAGYISLVGMPERDALLARYSEVSGRQVDDFDYYLVLARWKLGIVLEQGYQNAGDDPLLQSFGRTVEDLMLAAADLAESTDFRHRVEAGSGA
ncbi:phosphotransferase family protein [uncultured Jatrophihabitans sp.]|uniref:phosphotransferase family protein n=1 Tax=uncultured Jatrophihabitans sp. TaxID=1610747 RepID=UPI0035CBAB13